MIQRSNKEEAPPGLPKGEEPQRVLPLLCGLRVGTPSRSLSRQRRGEGWGGLLY